jgi:hypothetical protein
MVMGDQLGKFGTKLPHGAHGSLLAEVHGKRIGATSRKSSSPNAKRTSVLPPLTRTEFIRQTQEILCEFPSTQAAEEQDATPRAVESQRNGESGISSLRLINWARRNARVRAHVARLIGLSESITDPDFMQGASLVADYFARMHGMAECEQLSGDDMEKTEAPVNGDLFGGD